MSTAVATRQQPMRWLPCLVIATLASVAMAGLLTVTLWAIWPGVMAYAAPLACPGAFPDPFVQEHVYSVPGETSWSWSLLCMSPHGAIHRPGQSLPFALAVAILWLPCMAVALPVCAAIRRSRGQPAG